MSWMKFSDKLVTRELNCTELMLNHLNLEWEDPVSSWTLLALAHTFGTYHFIEQLIVILVTAQFVTPHFCPNLISNMFSMSKFLHSYTSLTWLHQNKYPFKVNTFNALQCTMAMFVSQCHQESDERQQGLSPSRCRYLSLSWHHWETSIHRVGKG